MANLDWKEVMKQNSHKNIERIIKEYLVKRYNAELEKLNDEAYYGCDEEIETGWELAYTIEVYFDWEWEKDDDAMDYFARATSQEINQYMIEKVIPKLELKSK